MNPTNLGNQLNAIVNAAKGATFDQGELAQLTYGAFDVAAQKVRELEQDEIEIAFPVGYKPDRTPIPGSSKYRKDQLLQRYQFLAFHPTDSERTRAARDDRRDHAWRCTARGCTAISAEIGRETQHPNPNRTPLHGSQGNARHLRPQSRHRK